MERRRGVADHSRDHIRDKPESKKGKTQPVVTATITSITSDLQRSSVSGNPNHRFHYDGHDEGNDEEEDYVNEFSMEGASEIPEFTRPDVSEISQQLLEIFQQYFIHAFTLLVKKKRLAPSMSFTQEECKTFGVEFPKFLHPGSYEYVNEFSKKMVTLLVRNVVEGCVMHVKIEKRRTSYIIQRFVFKTAGTVNIEKLSKKKNFDVEDVRFALLSSLLEIIEEKKIKPVLLPLNSRWSLSIGMKEEFATTEGEEGMKELWDCDPSDDYFPWKREPKNAPQAAMSSQMPSTSTASATKKPKVKKSERKLTAKKTNCLAISSFRVFSGFMMSVYSLEYPTPQIGSGSGSGSTNTKTTPPRRPGFLVRRPALGTRRRHTIKHSYNVSGQGQE